FVEAVFHRCKDARGGRPLLPEKTGTPANRGRGPGVRDQGMYSQRSWSRPSFEGEASRPRPPKSWSAPALSIPPTAWDRAPGTATAVPIVAYAPAAFAACAVPETHVHCEPSNLHRSFRLPVVVPSAGSEMKPAPPN